MERITTVSEAARLVLKHLEGCVLEAYEDGRNKDGTPRYSIGYGHNGATHGERITQAQADALFLHDVSIREKAVCAAVRDTTSQQQFDALVLFMYNVGVEAFRTSTLLQRHNSLDLDGASHEFLRWVHAQGVLDHRLEKRRDVERLWYLFGAEGSRRIDPTIAQAPDTGGTGGSEGG